jgi:hypothetical protein
LSGYEEVFSTEREEVGVVDVGEGRAGAVGEGILEGERRREEPVRGREEKGERS